MIRDALRNQCFLVTIKFIVAKYKTADLLSPSSHFLEGSRYNRRDPPPKRYLIENIFKPLIQVE